MKDSKALREWFSWLIGGALVVGSIGSCVVGCGTNELGQLRSQLEARIQETDAEVVGIYFKDLVSGDSLLLDADRRMHAASMMKVPVMVQLFRDAEAGRLSFADSLRLTKTFSSIVDGSAYELGVPDDSDTTLYARLGEKETIQRLTELMITVSSNLATNMLIEVVDAKRAQATMRELGADSIAVLRGVEDIKAYRAGLNNTTTARDLGVIFGAIADQRAASAASCREMVEILSRQEHNHGIPAGLPAGTRVAHKTGWITGIRHDGGIVYPDASNPFVLVVLTRGIAEPGVADELIADVARIVHQHVRPATASPTLLESSQARPARIAISFDDLPWNGPAPPGGISRATAKLLSSLEERGAPATGFVTCGQIPRDSAALRLWLEREIPLGNHSTDHRDLNDAPLFQWLDDVRRCDDRLRSFGAIPRYFRFPFLHQGPTAERRDAALAMLRELGYGIGHVTVDNSEWILARPYDRALRRGDETESRRIGNLFVEHIMAAVRHYQVIAQQKFGRDVDHILLLHSNALVTDHLASLLDTLTAQGFRFVTIAEALQDPVYRLADGYIGPKGLSWLYRAEPASPEDVAWDDAEAANLRLRLQGGDDSGH